MLAWLRRRARRERWRGRTVTQLAHASEGEILVVGRARSPGPLLCAPLTGRRCLAYQVRVFQTESESTTEIKREARCLDFTLEDETGTALVRVASHDGAVDADLELAVTLSGTVGRSTKAPAPATAAFLAAHGLKVSFWTGYSIEEAVLEEGAPAAVFGRARRVPDPDPASADHYREAPTRLAIEGAGKPLWISVDLSVVPRARPRE